MKKFYFKVVKNVITKDLADFIFTYFLLKRSVYLQLKNNPVYNKYNIHELFGITNDLQSPEAYSHYADTAMETLLEKVRPLVEKKLNKKLFSTYSYARIYIKGCDLKKHIDRLECEISITLNLGGDSWPIYVEDPISKKEIEINLKQGDMLIYKGCEVSHWRKKFKKNICVQVFLHYNEDKKENKIREFDGRLHLGLPKL
jgi:hypothetical protein